MPVSAELKITKVMSLPDPLAADTVYLIPGVEADELNIVVTSSDATVSRSTYGTGGGGGASSTFIGILTSGADFYNVAHNLNSTVMVQVVNRVTGEYKIMDIKRTDDDTVELRSALVLTDDHIVMCIPIGIMTFGAV